MTPLDRHRAAVEVLVNALHACASASPEAEFAAHEAFAALSLLGIDSRHSEGGKPRKTWAESVGRDIAPQPGLC